MAFSIADLLMAVRIPKGATGIGYGISAHLDGRTTEMRIAKQIALQSNPGCKVQYRETQWEREKDEKEGTWHHYFVVDEPNGHSYEYAIEAIKLDPKVLVACAFYDHNGKNYMVVATYDYGDGHLYLVTQENGTCNPSTN